MNPEKAKEILVFLVEAAEDDGIDRVSHTITDILLYRADPKFWDDWITSLPSEFIADQAEADRMMASLKEHFE